jgi:hypothetical protein
VLSLRDGSRTWARRSSTAGGSGTRARFVAYLRQKATYLRSVDCVTPQQIEEFVDAMNDVLLHIYRELQKPRPSPTRLRQLVAQYALDPRRPVAVPAHHIDVRRNDDGMTVAVLPPGVGRIRSLPYPGTVVRDPCAAQLLECLLLSAPPNYPAAMQMIEQRLGYVPDASSPTNLQPPDAAPGPGVTVDEGAGCITDYGRSYVVEQELVQIFQQLFKAPGNSVSSAELKKSPILEGTRIDRWLKKFLRSCRNWSKVAAANAIACAWNGSAKVRPWPRRPRTRTICERSQRRPNFKPHGRIRDGSSLGTEENTPVLLA